MMGAGLVVVPTPRLFVAAAERLRRVWRISEAVTEGGHDGWCLSSLLGVCFC